jgi:threonine dehydrogenase-like Zn-dependent dehydrogenase
MKAVVFHGTADIRLEEVDDPKLAKPTDAIVRLTASAICGTDLHLVRGTLGPMQEGTILGHEGIGLVEEVGADVRNVKVGDRVVIPSTIACGSCAYCRAGYFSQCDRSNPNGPLAGTAFYGGTSDSGPFDGMQAELVRVPFAHTGLVKLPEEIGDDDAVLLSDVMPTAYFGAKLAEIEKGNTVAVFGCGPVGQLAILSAQILGAGRVLAVDRVIDRLALARNGGAEVIDFDAEDPVQTLRSLTDGIGPDRIIDCVGVDSTCAHAGPAKKRWSAHASEYEQELKKVAPEAHPRGDTWRPGDAPSAALEWAVQAVAKAGTISVIGVYPTTLTTFPIGEAMNKNLTLNMGNCNHRKYVPELIALVRSGTIRPSRILTRKTGLARAIEAYEAFDRREPGWTKVELQLAA